MGKKKGEQLALFTMEATSTVPVVGGRAVWHQPTTGVVSGVKYARDYPNVSGRDPDEILWFEVKFDGDGSGSHWSFDLEELHDFTFYKKEES